MRFLFSRPRILIAAFAIAGACIFGSPVIAGTMDGGGGKFRKARPVTDEDVKSAVYRAGIVSPYVLKYIEATKNSTRGNYRPENGREELPFDPEVLQKLFPGAGKEDAYQKLAKMRFKPSDKPCRNKYGRGAASAYPYDSNEICFSIPMIRKSAKGANLEQRVLALALHEIAHKMGVESEKKAEAFEKLLQRALPADSAPLVTDEIESLYFTLTATRRNTVLSQLNGLLPEHRISKEKVLECQDELRRDPSIASYFSSSEQIIDWALYGPPSKGETCYKLAKLSSLLGSIGARMEHSNIPLEIFRPELSSKLGLSKDDIQEIDRFCASHGTGGIEESPKLVESLRALESAAEEALRALNASNAGLKGLFFYVDTLEAQ